MEGNIEKSSQEEENGFEAFVSEVEEMKRKEEETRETGHFLMPGFNPRELSEEDMRMWGKTKDESITEGEFFSYREEIMEQVKEKDPRALSRNIFQAFIANKVTGLFNERRKQARQ